MLESGKLVDRILICLNLDDSLKMAYSRVFNDASGMFIFQQLTSGQKEVDLTLE